MRKSRSWGAWVWGGVLVLAALGVLVLAVVLQVRLGAGTLQRISTEIMDIHADFDSFRQSAVAMRQGEDIYDSGARLVNLNPPIWTVLMAPFTLLEELNAYRLFVIVMLLTTIGYLAWMADVLRLRAAWAVVGVGMLVVSSPLLATFALGQMYPVLALGLVAAWVADRRGRFLVSGLALGLVLALKPSLAPLVLWPLFRRQWEMLGATIISGAAATLVGSLVLGSQATLKYAEVVRNVELEAFWDNASLPSAALRLFTENEFARPLADWPWVLPVAYAVGIGLVLFTAYWFRDGSEGGLWAMVAASLIVSPIAWNNYLILLGPGILLLMARRRVPLALLLLALQFIPPQWPVLWSSRDTILATLALTLYLYVLVAHWLSFLTLGSRSQEAPESPSTSEPAREEAAPG
ncbi:MAG: glycosyltransferase family 87 protein [Rubrobacteraceae bacterium]